jgi:DNA polymerase I-like protein with 3'-5' exonuclease and polymerase domains
MLEAVQPSPISVRYARARTRKLEAVVAAMDEAGVEAVWDGAEFRLDRLDRVTAPDRELLERLRPEIQAHLAEPGADDPEALLELLDIEVELVDDPEQARRVVTGLPKSVAIDIETEPRVPLLPPALRLTKDGRRFTHQPPADMTGASLDPYRGQPRLIQVFDPSSSTVFAFDMHALGYPDLAGLFDRRVLVHTMFEPVMLGSQGVELPGMIDTMQLASLTVGWRNGVRRLENVSKEILGLELPKLLQTSYWAARNLSDVQLSYAAGDPTVTYRAGRRMYQMLDDRERQAFWLANAAVPVISRMILRGLPCDAPTLARTTAARQADYARSRGRFHELTGIEVPGNVPATRAWLETTLTAEALKTWKRTDSGLLCTEAAQLLKASLDHPEIRPLIEVRKAAKWLEAFGDNLIGMISEATGRLHGDYFLPTKTGRLSCRKPAIQTFSQDVRTAVIAPEGHVFIDADLGQIELRVVAAQAGEQVMRAAFAAGQDIHALTASRFVGCSVDEVTPDQRTAAKPANFGLLFGMSARTLRDYAWSDYGLDWSLEQAEAVRNAFFELYPAIRPYQREQADRARNLGVLYSVAGRPRKKHLGTNRRDLVHRLLQLRGAVERC